MVIRKQYDIGKLVEQLHTEIEKSKKYNGVVKLDILTAHDILEVLQETHRREQEHQTLESEPKSIESEPKSIEKEDGTQTNNTEDHDEKPDCFIVLDVMMIIMLLIAICACIVMIVMI